MESQQIKNWLITETGIEWVGSVEVNYRLSKNRLISLGRGERSGTFDYLISIAEKSWVSLEDIYALNTAFFLAIDQYEIEIPRDVSIGKTIKLQLQTFDLK